MPKLRYSVNAWLVLAVVASQVFLSVPTQPSLAEPANQYLPQPHEVAAVDWAAIPRLDELELTSLSAIVVEVPSGRIVAARDADIELPLASVTKLMTAVVAMESKVGLETEVTYEAEDGNGIIARFVHTGDAVSSLKVAAGDKLRFRDLLAASLIASANNAAAAIARLSGLSRAEFVRRMNERAAVLGMPSANFTEVTGLDAENTASALDVAILARYAWRNLVLRELSGSPRYQLTIGTSAPQVLQHTNSLSRSQQRFAVLASKTGYLEEAGYNLAMLVRDRRQRQYLMVLMNAPTIEDRAQDAVALASWLETQP